MSMEVWKKIKQYPKYSVSSEGRVRTNLTGKIRSLTISNKGYQRVGLYPSKFPNHRQPDYINIGRLVAETFIENKQNLPEVNHIDGVKTNNSVSNLEWVSSSQNQIHAYRMGLQIHVKGSKHFAAKIKESDVKKIRKLYGSGKYFQYEIAEMFGINQQNISLICRGRAWSHVTTKQGGML